MLLRNFMEEKQLNYNQPFLSARRFSPTVVSSDVKDNKQANNSHYSIPALPFYKSDLKSGPVRTAGTVPFTWEKSPGRPKDERKLQIQALERPPVSPKLPPGRIVNVKKQTVFKVPQDPVLDRPQTGNALSSSNDVSSSNENVTIFERSKNKLEEKQSFCSEDGDEAYMDALDTLSRSESFFLNCSVVSGLSGLDGLDAKQSGTFNSDPETRDFMMGRFLPAAKAMASETPPYASRRQPVARELSRQRKNLVSEDKQPPVHRLKPNALPYYSHNSVEEKDDDDGDSDAHEHLSGKVCGLLPRFCLNNSFFLMNPVPEMRIGARVPASSVRRVPAKSSYTGSRSESEEQFKDAYQGRSVGGLPKTELHEDMSNHKGGSNHINSRKPDASSLYLRLQGGGISSYQHESSQSIFHEDKEFLGIPKEANNFRVNGVGSHKKVQNSFRDLLVDQSTKSDSGSASPVVEKTLYIDSVHLAESRNSNLSSSDTKGGMDTREIDSEILLKSGEMEEISSVESSLQDVKSFAGENVTSKHQTFESDYSCLISSPGGTNQEVKMEVMKGFREDQDLIKDSISLEGSIVSDSRKTNHENHQHPETDRTENLHATFPEFPLPPPLPKSPSESWLFRTLPSVSLRSQPPRSFLGMQKQQRPQASKKTVLDPKWETIVKTSESHHHGHLRFSEEQLTPIPEA